MGSLNYTNKKAVRSDSENDWKTSQQFSGHSARSNTSKIKFVRASFISINPGISSFELYNHICFDSSDSADAIKLCNSNAYRFKLK